MKKYSKKRKTKPSDKLGRRFYFIPYQRNFTLWGFTIYRKMLITSCMAYSPDHARMNFEQKFKKNDSKFWEVKCFQPIIDIEFISYMAKTKKGNK